MKYDKNKCFPYPVLRPDCDDFSDGDFQCIEDFEISDGSFNFTIEYNLSSEIIRKLIEENYAQYVCIISCRDTYYSTSISSNEPHSTVVLDPTIFYGEVAVNKYIQIIRDVKFKTNEINKDFGEGPYIYRKYDIIAQDEPTIYFFDREFFKPLTSIVDISIDEKLEYGNWTVDIEQHHINIKLNRQMKEKIDNARHNRNNQIILLNSLYLSAVSRAIYALQDENNALSDYRWAQVVHTKLVTKKLDINDDPIVLASKLMDSPLQLLADIVFKEEKEN